MDDGKCRFVETAMQIAEDMARSWFSNPSDIADVVRVAWEEAQHGKGNACSIAWYAVKRVLSGRHFPESERSVTCQHPSHRQAIRKDEAFDLTLLPAGDNPADIAAFRIDFAEWRDSLTQRQREVLDLLVAGWRTGELAAKLKVAPATISIFRNRLERRWDEFFAD